MEKCPTCGNEDIKKIYIAGRTVEEGRVYCDKCVSKREQFLVPSKKKKIAGAKKNG